MRALLSDLLDYTRLSADEQEPVWIDLNAVLRKVLENCQADIEDTEATVTAGPLPNVLGHEQHFIQLLQNLVSNSLKYRSAWPHIHVAAAKDNDHWRFSVADNGVGIDPAYHQTIFGFF